MRTSDGKWIPFNIDVDSGLKTYVCHYVTCTRKHEPPEPKRVFTKNKVPFKETQKNLTLKEFGV